MGTLQRAGNMVVVDGSVAEGGGQIVRTALALAMATAKPFRIHSIRANRKKPGLLRSHVAMIEAAARFCSAGFDGAVLGSAELTFFPGEVTPGRHVIRVPKSVPAALMLETILPALSFAGAPSEVLVEGGVMNAHAPRAEFLLKTYLPQLAKMGLKVTLESAIQPGAEMGVGVLGAQITPCARLRPVALLERGVPIRKNPLRPVTGLLGHRQADELDDLNQALAQLRKSAANTLAAKGESVTLEVAYEAITEIFSSFGTGTETNEALAIDAHRQARRYVESNAAVCEFLADQLLVPMAFAGSGRFTTTRVSGHVRANMETIRAFMPIEFRTEHMQDGPWLVEVRRTPV